MGTAIDKWMPLEPQNADVEEKTPFNSFFAYRDSRKRLGVNQIMLEANAPSYGDTTKLGSMSTPTEEEKKFFEETGGPAFQWNTKITIPDNYEVKTGGPMLVVIFGFGVHMDLSVSVSLCVSSVSHSQDTEVHEPHTRIPLNTNTMRLLPIKKLEVETNKMLMTFLTNKLLTVKVKISPRIYNVVKDALVAVSNSQLSDYIANRKFETQSFVGRAKLVASLSVAGALSSTSSIAGSLAAGAFQIGRWGAEAYKSLRSKETGRSRLIDETIPPLDHSLEADIEARTRQLLVEEEARKRVIQRQ
jgi:hypothetical protein